MKHKKNTNDFQSARVKMAKFCAYQERSVLQVQQKIESFDLSTEEAEKLLQQLIKDGFVDDSRFARIYAGSKFRLKKWGRIKINYGLKQHQIAESIIQKSLKEIDQKEYIATALQLLKVKKSTIKGSDNFIVNQKTADYMIRKGYEPELVWELLKDTDQT